VFQNPGPGYEEHPKSPASLLDILGLDEWTLAEWHLLPL
jgi:hypothetical protein